MGKFGSWDEGVGNFIRENCGYFLDKGVSCGLFHIHPLSIWQPSPRQWMCKALWEGEEVRIQLLSSDFKIFALSTPPPLPPHSHISAPLQNLLFPGVFLRKFPLGSLPPLRRSAWGRMLCLGQRQGCRDPTSHFYFQLQGGFWCLLPAGQPGAWGTPEGYEGILRSLLREFTEPDFSVSYLFEIPPIP